MAPRLSGTDLLRGDSKFAGDEVAPSISVTTTYKHPKDPKETVEELDQRDPSRHVYSRYTQNVSTRVEHILSTVSRGYALTYASGLAAAYSALIFYQPKRVCITDGYFGCHAAIEIYGRSRSGVEIVSLNGEFRQGDLCWLETPLNPTGESRDIKYYADKIHAVGGHLVVDSTLGPPPLQDPFKWGADCIMHSGTKYFGGHSDLLTGVLIVKTAEEWNQLQHDRTYMGNMSGSLESWLLLRSLRTLHLRVSRQSQSATELAKWLDNAASKATGQSFDGIPGGLIEKVWHSSLQGQDARGFDPKLQMEGGWNATFAMMMVNPKHAALLPHLLHNFTTATSLGGVESLMEQRVLSSPGQDPRLIRISVGLEDVEDLKDDLRKALKQFNEIKAKL